MDESELNHLATSSRAITDMADLMTLPRDLLTSRTCSDCKQSIALHSDCDGTATLTAGNTCSPEVCQTGWERSGHLPGCLYRDSEVFDPINPERSLALANLQQRLDHDRAGRHTA
jgi:hypothetical protein